VFPNWWDAIRFFWLECSDRRRTITQPCLRRSAGTDNINTVLLVLPMVVGFALRFSRLMLRDSKDLHAALIFFLLHKDLYNNLFC
jgi:nitrate reductase gamma subunit